MTDQDSSDGTEATISPIANRGESGPAEFYEVDLHVHTPGSHDYGKDISPDEFVQAVIEAGLDLIAVTDHDCPGWYEDIAEAATDTSLTVLPGVEITTAAGNERNIHLTAIFSPEKADQVDHLLHNIGINTANAADDEEYADEILPTICDEVRECGGLPILAHVDEKCGAAYELEEGRRKWDSVFDEEKVAALEATNPSELDFEGWPVIQSSDAHRPDHIGSRRTYIKMAEPSFEGLALAFRDPESRIAYQETIFDHPFIEGIKWDGGFFDGRHLRLSRNLNALIGGKGAGKSTVIEHLRYAFDIEPIESLRGEHESLIESTLAPDGEIEVHVTIPNEAEYVIRRSYCDEPEIYSRDGDEVPLDITQFREEYFDIAVYSQKEFIELARDNRSQMELLDEQFGLDDRHENIAEVLAQLQQNGSELEQLQQQAEDLRADVSELGALKEELRRMEDAGIGEYVEHQDAWDEEQRFFDRRQEVLEETEARITDIADWLDDEFSRFGAVSNPRNEDLIYQADEIAEDIKSSLERELSQLIEEAAMAREDLAKRRGEWENRRQEREEGLEAAAEDIESDIDVNVNDYLELKKRVEEQRAKKERLAEVEAEIDEIREKREQLLANLREAREELTDVRTDKIDELNRELDEIKVELQPDQNRSQYKEWLVENLNGSNVHTEDRQSLADEFDPQTLAKKIQDQEQDSLEEIGLTSTAARNVIAHNDLRENLHKLEVQPLIDTPVIKMKDRGSFKPLDEISEGQKCTALLSITLHEREDPILIDEPEDNLDNASIYDTIVQLLREIKHERQFITATHNANIPVLGDAEMIAALKPRDGRGFIEDRGPIEHEDIRAKVQAVLEGGSTAFRKRSQRYGYQ